jgi:8-oxo-dGTP pyrophosphatase MutT (NUDIX family)
MFAHLPAHRLVLDTSLPFEDCLAVACTYLRQEEEGHGGTTKARQQMWSFPLRRQLAAVELVNDQEQLLLQYRGSDAPTSPCQWSLLGGDIEPGETAEQAARREVREETGLHLEELLTLFWHSVLPSITQPASYNEWFVFLAHTQACQTHVIIGEGESMIFLPQSQIFRLDLAPSATYLLSLWVASQEKDSH